ncbi:MAG TPA: hypothetical protein VKD91_03615 [Pyrinomonadaceae bacterium]|nr:hypothetical protein [Pyrinomonadaceae bacterium]
MTLTIAQVNYLNIVLMIGSAVLAFWFPFELFLFSYAVLGPLHYLTEISWLHERRYFTEGRSAKHAHKGWLILVAVTMAALIAGYVAVEGSGAQVSPKWEITLFYLVFVTALLVTVVRARAAIVATMVISVLGLALFARSRYYIIVAFFLVTIIHVLIFTGSFVLYGALHSRSISGISSLVVFVLCAVSFFVFVPGGHVAGDYVRQSYRSFNALNAELIKLFRLGSGTSAAEVYESRSGLMIMRLIAFAYTYHYLNWFSKTSIIKWHEVPRSRTIIMLLAWLGALAIYLYDYDTGMAVLYFMSILHVMLEFPLNHRTFVSIGRELSAMAR